MIYIEKCEQKEKHLYRVSIQENPFYPDGKGGQLGDRGKIGTAKILQVFEKELWLDSPLEEKKEYDYVIDSERQQEIAQQHTAQHIFSSLAHRYFSWNTVGFRMAEDYSTVDLDHLDIPFEQIRFLEQEVNNTIEQSLSLRIFSLSSEKAHQLSLRKAISSKIQGEVRFVEVPGVDLCACGGFHVKNTLEIRAFKIIHRENIRGKFTRFYFLAGKRALQDYFQKHQITKSLSHRYSCQISEILEMQEKENKEKEALQREYHYITQKYASLLSKKLEEEAIFIQGKPCIIFACNSNLQKALARLLSLETYTCILGEEDTWTLYSPHWNCKILIQALTTSFEGIKGGGNERKGNLKGRIEKNAFLSFLENYREEKSS
ncbi:alanyl-tRNA editing protein [Fusobacterium necrophorum]|uniref:tRNA ligase n=2 Tax=Fusobacterium necrophorum TaxID=859 RepID=A0AB73BUW4_9FUSO|nr:alanyl-tRNA editing protein [Fusobacterium necrophorum]KDE62211.1 tRNA ligase [Fusobacterium necrophorum BL]KDE64185.1 tRNA ligase [Fusobacterium necrophorum BFTR-1]KDE67607.1 tRNA ligase [Fusobacterium necrophorum DJ-1]KDE72029.1 tRNA ligase [Fusobacterium necrophorum DJ-2]KDE73552.1 tRNA ligase [Fusobacterium necrophorum BFTR-2]